MDRAHAHARQGARLEGSNPYPDPNPNRTRTLTLTTEPNPNPNPYPKQELDWSREEALRLDRVNRHLTKESARLKAQLKSQEDDRDFLVRQVL